MSTPIENRIEPVTTSARETLLETERRYAGPAASFLAILTLSGFATYLAPTLTVWAQWTTLLHTLAGLLGATLIGAYLVAHFRRTLGLRRPGAALSGWLSALLFLFLAGTGVWIAWYGQREMERWILTAHVLSACVTFAVIGLHLLLHGLWFPTQRRRAGQSRFNGTDRSTGKAVALALTGAVVAVTAATLLYALRPSPYRDEAVVQPYQTTYGDHPFRPSQTETSTGGFLDPRRVGQSANCATCHAEIAAQWRESIHAQAAADKAYQTNINLLAERKGMPATRYCEGCHAPVALLSGQLTTGGHLDTQGHLQEGVSCMSCHGIERVENVKGVASYRFAPTRPYLFEGATNAVGTFLHNWLVRVQPRQHRADLARDVLAAPELCATCHAQFMDKEFNGWGWVKMQDDYTAWLNSPYSRQSHQTYSQEQIRRCQDCHFPRAPGEDPSADSAGLIKTHFNAGANTAIPWFIGNRTHLQRVEQFLRTDRMRITIDRPNRPNAIESSKHLDPKLMPSQEAPGYFYLGERVALKVAVTNSGVGHAFPGGTTDINEAWIHLTVTDAHGRAVYESGALNEAADVDSGAYFYKSTAIDRFGNEVWRHDLFNMIGDSFKRVVPPGGTDVAMFEFAVPDWVKGPLTVTTDLNYRKLNNRYAKWALKDDAVRLPIVIVATDTMRLNIRTRPAVSSEFNASQ